MKVDVMTTAHGYQKFGDLNDHLFAKFLRKVSNRKWDFETCGTHSIFYIPHPTERAKYKPIAVVTYDNYYCTKSVNVTDEFAPVLKKMLEA